MVFPFLKLPLELRNEIYYHALWPRADFIVRDGDSIQFTEDQYTVEGEDDYHEEWKMTWRVTTTASSVLLVNKQVSTEARTVLRREAPSFDSLIAGFIIEGKITKSPSRALQAIWPRSRLVFCCNARLALDFLGSLRVEDRCAVRSIVITSEAVENYEHGNRSAWSKTVRKSALEDTTTPFTAFLRKSMPRLREVALYVPQRESPMYCHYALEEICSLLRTGKLQVVRVFFEQVLPANFSPLDNPSLYSSIRSNIACMPGMTASERAERLKTSRDESDVLLVTREYGPQGEPPMVWTEPSYMPGTIFALKRPGSHGSRQGTKDGMNGSTQIYSATTTAKPPQPAASTNPLCP